MFAKATVKVNSICSIAAAVSVIKLSNWLRDQSEFKLDEGGGGGVEEKMGGPDIF